MVRQRMVAFENVMQVAGEIGRAKFDSLAKADQRRTCAFLRDLRKGRTEVQVRRAAEKKLKPKAVDWDKILDFFNTIMPLIIKMITKV